VNGRTANRASWAQQFAIAAAYAACYELARYLSFSHWLLTAGLRLACLFLVPVRFWPALILGETLPSIETALLLKPQYGGAWALAAAVPMVLLWIPVVRPLRRRWSLYAPDGSLRASVLLTATLGCALVNSIALTLELQTALLANPGEWPEISAAAYFWAYLLGGFLGALTLTPTLLALHQRARSTARPSLASVWHSPLARDLVTWVVPVCGGLAWVALATDQELTRQVARLALLLPVFALALRRGWHGTALAGMVASVALAATGTTLLDPAMIRCQAVLALALSGTLLVGSKVTRDATLPSSAIRTGR
jgi:two-component system, NarL family, sensor histidine kinase UhpB